MVRNQLTRLDATFSSLLSEIPTDCDMVIGVELWPAADLDKEHIEVTLARRSKTKDVIESPGRDEA